MSRQPRKRQRLLTSTEVHEKTSHIVLSSNANQLYQLLSHVHVPVSTSTVTLASIHVSVQSLAHPVQSLALHNLRSLPSYQPFLQLDLLEPPLPSHAPLLLLILATTSGGASNLSGVLRDYLDVQPGKKQASSSSSLSSSSSSSPPVVRLGELLSTIVSHGMDDELRESLASALRDSTTTKWTAASIQRLLSPSSPTSSSSSSTLSVRYVLLVSYLARQIDGDKMSTLQSISVMQSIANVSYRNKTLDEVIQTCRSLVEHLAQSFQSVADDVSEKRRLMFGFFVICNKSYEKLVELEQRVPMKRLLLIPMEGWTTLASAGGGHDDDEVDAQGHLLESERATRQRPRVVVGRFWTDQITCFQWKKKDVHDLLRQVRADVTGRKRREGGGLGKSAASVASSATTTTLWDIFHRVACLCEDTNDSFRMLWKLADHLPIVGSISTPVGAASTEEGEEEEEEEIKLQSMVCYCKMTVSSLRSLTTDRVGSTSTPSTNEMLKMSIRCLTKLIGAFSDIHLLAWSTLINVGVCTALNNILLRHNHFNDNGVVNTLSAMYCLLEASLDLDELYSDDGRGGGRRLCLNVTEWTTARSRMMTDISDTMFCRGVCGVMKKMDSCKITHEAFELLVNNMCQVWCSLEGKNILDGSGECIAMETLSRGLSRCGLVTTMKHMLRRAPKGGRGEGEGRTKESNQGEVVVGGGTLRQVLNGKMGSEKGDETGNRLHECLLWILQNEWNEVLAKLLLEENEMVELLWDCMMNTKHGLGTIALQRLQTLKFGHVMISGARSKLLSALLNACPLLN